MELSQRLVLALFALISVLHIRGVAGTDLPTEGLSSVVDSVGQRLKRFPGSSIFVEQLKDAAEEAPQIRDPVLRNIWIHFIHVVLVSTWHIEAAERFTEVKLDKDFEDLRHDAGAELREAWVQWSMAEDILVRRVDMLTILYSQHMRKLWRTTGSIEATRAYNDLGHFMEVLSDLISTHRSLPDVFYMKAFLTGLLLRGDESTLPSLEEANRDVTQLTALVGEKLGVVVDAAQKCVSNGHLPKAVVSFIEVILSMKCCVSDRLLSLRANEQKM